MPPPWEAITFRFGYWSKKPLKIIRVMASVVSNMKPTDHDRSNWPMSIRSAPGGSVGCTSTGSARRSISAHTGAKSGSVRLRPATLASTITPTAPWSQARRSSSTARCGYSQGSEANQRSRSGWRSCASATLSLASCAACTLTASPPQYTLGQVSETMETSMPASFMARMRSSQSKWPFCGMTTGVGPRNTSCWPSGRVWML